MNELRRILLEDLDQAQVLALNSFMEARNEYKRYGNDALTGPMAVVLNRAAHPSRHKFTIKEVVADQVAEVVGRWRQFSWTNCDEYISDPQYDLALGMAQGLVEGQDNFGSLWNICFDLAEKLLAGEIENPVENATYYFNPRVCAPSWAAKMRLIKNIGNHRFMAEKGDPEVLWTPGMEV